MDVIEKYGGIIEEWNHAGGVFLRLPAWGSNFRFLGLTSDKLRQSVEQAMDFAVPHYKNNVTRVGAALDESVVEQAALAAILGEMAMRNEWRGISWIFRSRKPIVTEKTLGQVSAKDRIYFFCKRRFGDSAAQQAAALLGMTEGEFAEWEAQRRKFWELW